MKHIVVIGGGFAGITAIVTLQKYLSAKEAKITLIDKNVYHLFTPSLYEVATSEETKKNIVIPFREIFGNKIEYIQNEVTEIKTREQKIVCKNHTSFSYDYLLLAAGSEPAYFHIPGLKENSIPLKSLSHAITIRNKILSLCCKEGQCNKRIQVIIGGGGFSGTEIAAELLTYKDKIAKQHHLDANCLEITVIQGSNRLLKELDIHVSRIAQKRLQAKNLHFAFGGHIRKVTKTSIFTDDDKVYQYDLLIWTGGVQANALAWKSNLPVNKKGQVTVNEFLQVKGFENIFAAGDIVEFIDEKTKTSAPTVAEVAEDEGKIAGKNIAKHIKNISLTPYTYRHLGYIIPLRGKYAAVEFMGIFHIDGFLGWVIQQFIFLYYLIQILSFSKALKRWNTFEESLEQ